MRTQESFRVDNWTFEEHIIDASINRKALFGLTEIAEMEDGRIEEMLDNEVLIKVRDSVELPLVALSFCLDGVFRANPQKMQVTSLKDNRTLEVFLEDWSHPTFGRNFSQQESEYAEKLTKALKKSKFLVKLFGYYQFGLFLYQGFYYTGEAFLNFYKVIEIVSQEICKKHSRELKSEKENKLDVIASKILNERRLDDTRHSEQVKRNQIKKLVSKYMRQREISAKDQIAFTCGKLSIKQNQKRAERLVEIRNRGDIAQSSRQSDRYLKELRQCRDLAREFILK